MITTQLTDAIGNPVTTGYAAIVEPGRGSIYARTAYVVGTKKTKVVYLNARYGTDTLQDLIKGYQEGNPDVPVYTIVPTRVIMLNPKENN